MELVAGERWAPCRVTGPVTGRSQRLECANYSSEYEVLSLFVRLFLISWIVGVAAPGTAEPAQDVSGVIVLDVRTTIGIKPEFSQLLTDILLVRLREAAIFKEVLGAADVAKLLELEQQKTLLGCADEQCLAQIGGALGVPFFLRSQIGVLGEAHVLTMHLVRVEDAKVVARSLAQAKGESALMMAIGSALDRLFKDFKGGVPSTLTGPARGARSWKAIAGYGLSALGLGLYVLAGERQSNAQERIESGPMAIDELELARSLTEIGEAKRLGWAGASAATLGAGLVIWGLVP